MSKRPPVFTEGMDYDQWKKDVTLRTLVSELDETKHAVMTHGAFVFNRQSAECNF